MLEYASIRLEEVRADHGVCDGLHPQDRVERHREQHTAHQAGHRCGGLAVGVRQPAVHRCETGLGGEAEHREGAARADEGGVERQARLAEHEPGQRSLSGGPGGCVDEEDAEQGDRDADGTQDHVLPGGLERLAGAVRADEERGRDRGRLDRSPHQADVVCDDGERHGGEEHRDQAVV
jgi:hypothetical protein